jgi:peroxiredoxin
VLDTVKARQATRPPVHAHDLEDEVLKDDSGRDVRLGDLWRDRPTALVFLRHFGCVFCRQHAVRLHRARRKFDDAGVGLAVIGMGTPEDAAEFRRIQDMELPVLVDPDRRTYELAGAKIATLDELLSPKVVARGIKHTILSRLRFGSVVVHQGRIQGHAAQLGGVLVVAPDGSVRYAHLSKDASDDPPPAEVLAAARAIRPRTK